MAKMLGNLCKIIHCSDGLNHKIFNHFLNGICKSGIWGLFTKFNRISQKTLSVISTLLFSLKSTLFGNKNEINVSNFKLKIYCGFCYDSVNINNELCRISFEKMT